ncbi:MAG: NAD(P)H-dependent oxidoreductase subunit E [Thermoguttaceae bacterium]
MEERLQTDLEYSLETVACIGACGLAPCAMINNKVEAQLTPEKVAESLRKAADDAEGLEKRGQSPFVRRPCKHGARLRVVPANGTQRVPGPLFSSLQRRAQAAWQASQDGRKPRILVGTATCGRSAGALEVLDALGRELHDRGPDCRIMEVGCLGLCYAEPVVTVFRPSRPGIAYGNVAPAMVPRLVAGCLLDGDPKRIGRSSAGLPGGWGPRASPSRTPARSWARLPP